MSKTNLKERSVPLSKPLTKKAMRALAKADASGYINGVVSVDLSDLIDNDLEGFLDLISQKLTGTDILGDINYAVVGCDGDTIFIAVTGDPELVLH